MYMEGKMKVKTLRKIAYVLIFAMMVEAITLNININAFSKKTITLEKMNESKVKALLWLKEKQKRMEVLEKILKHITQHSCLKI